MKSMLLGIIISFYLHYKTIKNKLIYLCSPIAKIFILFHVTTNSETQSNFTQILTPCLIECVPKFGAYYTLYVKN